MSSSREKRLSSTKVVYKDTDDSEEEVESEESHEDDSEVEIKKSKPQTKQQKDPKPTELKSDRKILKKNKAKTKVKMEDDESQDDDDSKSSEIKPKKNKNNQIKTEKRKNQEDNDEDDDDEERPKSKKPSSSETRERPAVARRVRDDIDRTPKMKKMGKLERLEEARQAFKWWEAEELPDGINWRKLEHTGIVFPPPYIKHNIPLVYDGKEIILNEQQEEIVTFYAAMPDDGPQLGNPKTAPVFQKNFFEDFQKMLSPGHEIKKFNKCDFSRIREYLELQKNLRKATTNEEKSLRKADKESELEKQGFALIDGRLEKMGNYRMEPPGLFRGRGEHPKTGCLKTRSNAEDVTLNLSMDSCVPVCDIPGHAWQSIRHDPSVTWLCNWQENVQNQYKYVMLAASSSFKGKSDMEKYTKAINLKNHIDKVRKDYTKKIKSVDVANRQLGVAMWVIDVLALRVGGEKGEDEADTVGCCSLRIEHLTFNPASESYEIELEFLGKDSMLYKQNINYASYGDLGKLVYRSLKSFCTGKKANQNVFDTLTPERLNKHLNSLMNGLTAKVFRTFNASITLEKELPSATELDGLSIQEKIGRYNAANRSVAILCNHQKTVSKAAETMFENLNEKLDILKSQRDELVSWKELAKKDKVDKIPRKDDDKDVTEPIVALLKAALKSREDAKTTEEKLGATAAVEEAKMLQKQDQRRRLLERHKFKSRSEPSVEDIENKIAKWNEDIRKLEVDIRNRDENKEVALGTSKINYMDPRISVAWCKRCEVPMDKIFAKTLRDKFNWAMAVPPDWKFE
eukprot:gene2032-3949_t